MSVNEITDDHVVHLSRTLAAPPDRVWRAMTDQGALTAWFWPARFEPTVDVDLRVGGGYRIAAGTGEMAVSGEYVTIEPERRLVMLWRWDGDEDDSVVTIEFSGAAETELLISHERLGEAAAPQHLQGWSDCLQRLPGYLEHRG